MEVIGHHLMFRLLDDRVLVPGIAKRRTLARTVYRLAEPAGLVAFGVADTHLHVSIEADRVRAGKLAHDLCCALHFAIEPKQLFERTRIKAIESQRHLQAVIGYAFRQKWHHGIQVDALRDGTSLPELLGLRLLAGPSLQRVRELLPRVSREELMRWLGPGSLEPALQIREDHHPPELLIDAVAGAFGLAGLSGGDAWTRRARATLLQLPLTRPLAIAVRDRLAISRSGAARLRGVPLPPSHPRAVKLQIGLRRWLEEHGRRDEDSLG